MTQKRKLEDLDDYLQDVAHDGAEYVYLWDEKEKEWKYAVAKTKDGRQLGLQVLESELIEEDFVEEGRNAFITAARAAKGKGLKEFEFKGKTFPVTVKDVNEETPEVEETEEAEEVTENKLVSESFGEFIASLNEETVNEWGTSDSYAMSEVIHYMIRKPKNMPSPFDKKLRDAAESAVDRYWSEWEEYKTNYEGLVDDAVRTYLRHFHREEFKLAQRMFEPVESNSIETGEDVNEAFKSAKLAQLFNTKVSRSWSSSALKDLPSAFYNMANVALDKVEDEDLIDMSAAEAHAITRKDKSNRYVIFYIVDQQKKNPYADYEGQTTIPAGILAIVKGNNFQGMAWGRNSSGRGRTLASSEPADSVGISKKYKGWDSTGLYNPKRISEVADRAVVLDISVLRDKYSTAGKKADRAAAKKGAIAFKSDKDFRRENMNRYKEILADKAANLPLDKMVKDAVDSLTLQIQQGLAKGEVENGEPIIGRNSKGRAVKMRDASNHMSQILDNYSNYVRYSNEAQTSLTSSSYYEERVKQEAKSIKDRIDKIEKMDYAW
jgi:hypothetical protein